MPAVDRDGKKILQIAVVGSFTALKATFEGAGVKHSVLYQTADHFIDSEIYSITFPVVLENGATVKATMHPYSRQGDVFAASNRMYDAMMILESVDDLKTANKKKDVQEDIDYWKNQLEQQITRSGTHDKDKWGIQIPIIFGITVRRVFKEEMKFTKLVKELVAEKTFKDYNKNYLHVVFLRTGSKETMTSALENVIKHTLFDLTGVESGNFNDIDEDYLFRSTSPIRKRLSEMSGLFHLVEVQKGRVREARAMQRLEKEMPSGSLVDWFRIWAGQHKTQRPYPLLTRLEVSLDMEISGPEVIEAIRNDNYSNIVMGDKRNAVAWWERKRLEYKKTDLTYKGAKINRFPITRNAAKTALVNIKLVSEITSEQLNYDDMLIDVSSGENDIENSFDSSSSVDDSMDTTVNKSMSSWANISSSSLARINAKSIPTSPRFFARRSKTTDNIVLLTMADPPVEVPGKNEGIVTISKTQGYEPINGEDYLEPEPAISSAEFQFLQINGIIKPDTDKTTEIVRVCVIGSHGVGKTSFVTESNDPVVHASAGHKMFMYAMNLENDEVYDPNINRISFEVMENTDPKNTNVVVGTRVAIVVCSVDDRRTYSQAVELMSVARNVYDVRRFILINNKEDLISAEDHPVTPWTDYNLAYWNEFVEEMNTVYGKEIIMYSTLSFRDLINSGTTVQKIPQMLAMYYQVLKDLKYEYKSRLVPRDISEDDILDEAAKDQAEDAFLDSGNLFPPGHQLDEPEEGEGDEDKGQSSGQQQEEEEESDEESVMEKVLNSWSRDDEAVEADYSDVKQKGNELSSPPLIPVPEQEGPSPPLQPVAEQEDSDVIVVSENPPSIIIINDSSEGDGENGEVLSEIKIPPNSELKDPVDNMVVLGPDSSITQEVMASDVVLKLHRKLRKYYVHNPVFTEQEVQERALLSQDSFVLTEPVAVKEEYYTKVQTFPRGRVMFDIYENQFNSLLNNIARSGWQMDLTMGSRLNNSIVRQTDENYKEYPMILSPLVDWPAAIDDCCMRVLYHLVEENSFRNLHPTMMTERELLNYDIEFQAQWRAAREKACESLYFNTILGSFVASKINQLSVDIENCLVESTVLDEEDKNDIPDDYYWLDFFASSNDPSDLSSKSRALTIFNTFPSTYTNSYEPENPTELNIDCPLTLYVQNVNNLRGVDYTAHNNDIEMLRTLMNNLEVPSNHHSTNSDIKVLLRKLHLDDGRTPAGLLTLLMTNIDKISLLTVDLITGPLQIFDLERFEKGDSDVAVDHVLAELKNGVQRNDGESIGYNFWNCFFDQHLYRQEKDDEFKKKAIENRLNEIIQLVETEDDPSDVYAIPYYAYSFQQWSGKEDLNTVPDFLYRQDNIYLLRGRDIFRKIIHLFRRIKKHLVQPANETGTMFFLHTLQKSIMYPVSKLIETEVMGRLKNDMRSIAYLWKFYVLMMFTERFMYADLPLTAPGQANELKYFQEQLSNINFYVNPRRKELMNSLRIRECSDVLEKVKGQFYASSHVSFHSTRDLLLEEMYIRTTSCVSRYANEYVNYGLTPREKIRITARQIYVLWKEFLSALDLESYIRPLEKSDAERIRMAISDSSFSESVVGSLLTKEQLSHLSADQRNKRWNGIYYFQRLRSLLQCTLNVNSVNDELRYIWQAVSNVVQQIALYGDNLLTNEKDLDAFIAINHLVTHELLPRFGSSLHLKDIPSSMDQSNSSNRMSFVLKICEIFNYLMLGQDNDLEKKPAIKFLNKRWPDHSRKTYLYPALLSVMGISLFSWTWVLPFICSLDYHTSQNPDIEDQKVYDAVTEELLFRVADSDYDLVPKNLNGLLRSSFELTPCPSAFTHGITMSNVWKDFVDKLNILSTQINHGFFMRMAATKSNFVGDEDINMPYYHNLLFRTSNSISKLDGAFAMISNYFKMQVVSRSSSSDEVTIKPEISTILSKFVIDYGLAWIEYFMISIAQLMEEQPISRRAPFNFDFIRRQLFQEPVYDFGSRMMFDSVVKMLVYHKKLRLEEQELITTIISMINVRDSEFLDFDVPATYTLTTGLSDFILNIKNGTTGVLKR